MAKLTTLEGIHDSALSKPVVKYGLIAGVGIGALLLLKHNTNMLGDKVRRSKRSKRRYSKNLGCC